MGFFILLGVFILSLVAFAFLLVGGIKMIGAEIRSAEIDRSSEAEAAPEKAAFEAPAGEIEPGPEAGSEVLKSASHGVDLESPEVGSSDSAEAVGVYPLEPLGEDEAPSSEGRPGEPSAAEEVSSGEAPRDRTAAGLDSAEALLELEKALDKYVRDRASSKRPPAEGRDEPSAGTSDGFEETAEAAFKRDATAKGKVLPEELRSILDSIMADHSPSAESVSASAEVAGGFGGGRGEEGDEKGLEIEAPPVSETGSPPGLDSEKTPVSKTLLGGASESAPSVAGGVGSEQGEAAMPPEEAGDEAASSTGAGKKKALKAEKEKVLKDLKRITGRRKGLFKF